MNLYISDLHFGHKNVITFDHRPFQDCDEMDHVLIQLWNARVQPDDHVYIIGDFCNRNEKPEEWYLRQLAGHKHLIIGNHDGKLLKNERAMTYFASVEKMMHVSDNGRQLCLCHFPLAEWNGFYKGHWHVYGHIHNHKNETWEFMRTRVHALNAGCMINNYAPASLDDLIRNNRIFQEN